MHEDLAGVDGGKEVAAEIGRQQEGGGDERQEADDEDRPPLHRQFENAAVALADMLEAGFEGALDAHERVARGGAGAVLAGGADAASADNWPSSAPACATG